MTTTQRTRDALFLVLAFSLATAIVSVLVRTLARPGADAPARKRPVRPYPLLSDATRTANGAHCHPVAELLASDPDNDDPDFLYPGAPPGDEIAKASHHRRSHHRAAGAVPVLQGRPVILAVPAVPGTAGKAATPPRAVRSVWPIR